MKFFDCRKGFERVIWGKMSNAESKKVKESTIWTLDFDIQLIF
jgi:hypothetical protein